MMRINASRSSGGIKGSNDGCGGTDQRVQFTQALKSPFKRTCCSHGQTSDPKKNKVLGKANAQNGEFMSRFSTKTFSLKTKL